MYYLSYGNLHFHSIFYLCMYFSFLSIDKYNCITMKITLKYYILIPLPAGVNFLGGKQKVLSEASIIDAPIAKCVLLQCTVVKWFKKCNISSVKNLLKKESKIRFTNFLLYMSYHTLHLKGSKQIIFRW